VQTISQLNSMLDGRDQMVLTEALEAAAENGHGEIINIMFRGRAWLWAIVKSTSSAQPNAFAAAGYDAW
jgi:hypothetical protein